MKNLYLVLFLENLANLLSKNYHIHSSHFRATTQSIKEKLLMKARSFLKSSQHYENAKIFSKISQTLMLNLNNHIEDYIIYNCEQKKLIINKKNPRFYG